MRAVAFDVFGGPEVLHVAEMPEPQAGPGTVVVKVAAATINPTDVMMLAGKQAVVRTSDGRIYALNAITMIVLEPVLALGLGPIPAMGAQGAGLATVKTVRHSHGSRGARNRFTGRSLPSSPTGSTMRANAPPPSAFTNSSEPPRRATATWARPGRESPSGGGGCSGEAGK